MLRAMILTVFAFALPHNVISSTREADRRVHNRVGRTLVSHPVAARQANSAEKNACPFAVVRRASRKGHAAFLLRLHT